ncbi:LOW QUALITY PROTEIN: cell division cycle-associated protein 3 [Coregonus clupeaformis]|uniref:LOW QUALITY PROTEIN: cell division cycle-associated protein 3 n=1 Tax=Coregonus clupeaformis TaxID=59861 RepID=UPI001E1C6C53|nr:LOW QUALITY PROTEIN: cell division cycle-associated protein 3 [Coregonus clupeaformis]
MGSSESKVAVASTPKPVPSQRIRHDRLSQLVDPRSPSVTIDRTPIQVGGTVSCVPVVVESDCSILASDPRSPSVGVTRTPMKDSMRVTVGSFARRLGMLLHGDSVEIVAPAPFNTFPNQRGGVGSGGGRVSSSEPLLSPQPSQVSGDMIRPSPQSVTSHTLLIQSPFVLVGEAQIEVEADFTLEEADEAKESSLHKRLSMSLITCHDGIAPSQTLAEVHHESPESPLPDNTAAELHKNEPDHAYALPSITSDPAQPLTPMAEPSIPTVTELTEVTVATEMPKAEEKVEVPTPVEEPVMPVTQESPVVPSPTTTGPSPSVSQQQPKATGIRCPTFDTKSPSQVVFKPQWLGKGFGPTGVRARGRGGKGGSSFSPRSVQVGNKNTANENKGQSVKQKQRDKALVAEGRSPLQMLKETNSPREQATQMKLKVSTPDRQRLGQMDRRVLTVSLDKENR